MIDIMPYKPEHAIEVVATHDSVAASGLKFGDDAHSVAEFMAGSARSSTFKLDGRVIGCGGICDIGTGCGEAWAVYVSDIATVRIDPQIPKKLFWKWVQDLNLSRVQAPIRDGFEAGESYCRYLGFHFEKKVADYYGDGQDANMWVIKREVQ